MTAPKPVGNPVQRLPAPKTPTSEGDFTLDGVDPVGRTEALLYSAPGTGKTVMAGTFPGPFRWLDTDRGTKSLVWALKAGKMSVTDPKDVVIFQPHEELDGQYPKRGNNVTAAFDQMTDKIDYWFSSADVQNWETLVVDSFTEINEWALNKGLYLNSTLPERSKPLSRSENINQIAKVRLLTGEQDYKSAQGLCQGFITDVRIACAQHSKNLVVICHEYAETSEDSNGNVKVVKYMPMLIGQLRQRLVKDFDDVWYLEMRQTLKDNKMMPEVLARLHGDSLHIAKTRWGAIVSATEPADYRTLVQKVRAYHNA